MKYHNSVTEIAPSEFTHGNKTIGVVADKLVDENTYRRSILIQNLSATNNLYIGNAGVTTANTVKIAPGEGLTLYSRSAIYAVADADTCDVRYLEEYCG
jgi:hypothetical protein